ncbi:MAG TPA: LpqB family beta-propeller domain-containing protein [Candidatus Acidoferrales bacterium]|nr:LpqB family beta-propeller domain-containing protein [Candidatus Acidoferrales bacterium]
MANLKKFLWMVLAGLLATTVSARAQRTSASASTEKARPAYSEPGVSPDGKEIAFVSGGNIWTVPAAGGEARLLVSDTATDSRPLYSPDGTKLAYVSARDGSGNVYVLTFATGEAKRLTYDDALDRVDGWSRDGKWIYFSSANHDISYMNDVYRVSVEGGTPMAVAADRYANEYFAAPSPDGKTVAITARGIVSEQWWRKGHSHLDESEIWLVRDGATPKYEAVTDGSAKDLWPMWSANGRELYYVSDRSGAQNIWAQAPGGKARGVTQFKAGRVLWPSISNDGRTIVFERHFGIWKLDTASGRVNEVAITRRGIPAGPAVEHLRLTDHIRDLALSPDGKKVAFVAHGEVFAASAKDGGDAMRVTYTPGEESEVRWAPDSRRLVYVSDRDGLPHLFLYDFTTSKETRLTHDTGADAAPRFSADGKMLAFERDGRELRVMDLESKQERMIASGHFGRPPFETEGPLVWSPDGKWIAYIDIADNLFRNVWAVPVAGGKARPVSFLPDAFSGSVTWSPDGTYVLFNAGQRTEMGQIARVDLIPRAPKFREDEFRDLFKEKPKSPTGNTKTAASDAEEKSKATPARPVTIDWDGIRDRISLVETGLDAGSETISPDGKWLLLNASVAGQENLYLYSLDELSKEPRVARQLTSTPGPKADAQFSPDGKEVYYLDRGKIQIATVATHTEKPLAVIAEMDVDFARQKVEMFDEAWTYLRDFFFDPNHNGADWNEVRSEYEPRVGAAANPDEVRRLISLMLGELNGSHLGISGAERPQPTVGRIGLDFDRAEAENFGHLRVTNILPLGPAELAGGIKTGEYLTAVDGQAIGAHTNLDALLEHKIGKRVALTMASSADGADAHTVVVQPVTTSQEKELLYHQWVERNRAYVERVSGGKLGYVHIPDMGEGSLQKFYLDLDTQNRSREGVVIDIRSNTGGFVNAYALDVLSRRPYLSMTPRDFPTAPARSELGQRSLELPTILVTNQHSLSDAEDFTEGYRSMKLGKVVGEPTAGWIIYTSGTQLIDGSFLRLPFIRITAADGTPMELHPRPVDFLVKRPMGESYTDHDVQLDTAVRELLKEIPNSARPHM